MRKGKEMNQSKTTRERMGRWGGKKRKRGRGGNENESVERDRKRDEQEKNAEER